MTITIDQLPLQHLHRLWMDRAKSLHHAAMLIPDGPMADKIRGVASAYGQCAEELENPPQKLFQYLGYDEPKRAQSKEQLMRELLGPEKV